MRFSRMENTPCGVGWPGTPVETGECATGTPPAYKVSCCFLIEMTMCSGPGGSFSPSLRTSLRQFLLLRGAPCRAVDRPAPSAARRPAARAAAARSPSRAHRRRPAPRSPAAPRWPAAITTCRRTISFEPGRNTIPPKPNRNPRHSFLRDRARRDQDAHRGSRATVLCAVVSRQHSRIRTCRASAKTGG